MSTLLKLATPIKASNLYKSCVCVPKKLHNRRPQTVCVFQHRNTLQLQFATSRAGRQRIARQRQAQQSRAGRQIKDCEAVSGGHGSPELEDKCKGLEGKGGSLCPPCLPSVSLYLRSCLLLVGHCVRLISLLYPFVSLLVTGLASLLVGHCARLVSQSLPFVSQLWSAVWQCFTCLPAPDCCVRLSLAILITSALSCCVRLCLAIL